MPRAITYIINSHKRGRTSTVKKYLKAVSGPSCWHLGRRIPRHFLPAHGVEGATVHGDDPISFAPLAGTEAGAPDREDAVVECYPPALPPDHGKEYYNVVKFYSLSSHAVHSVMKALDVTGAVSAQGQEAEAGQRGQGQAEAAHAHIAQLPMIPDEFEDQLIQAVSKPESVLLVGRSGTGKTSIAIGRMFAMYSQMTAGGDAYRQLFVTASPVLRDEVRRSFQALAVGKGGCGSGVGHEARYQRMSDVHDDSWPLFLTQAEWLCMLDASLPAPFLARRDDGRRPFLLSNTCCRTRQRCLLHAVTFFGVWPAICDSVRLREKRLRPQSRPSTAALTIWTQQVRSCTRVRPSSAKSITCWTQFLQMTQNGNGKLTPIRQAMRMRPRSRARSRLKKRTG